MLDSPFIPEDSSLPLPLIRSTRVRAVLAALAILLLAGCPVTGSQEQRQVETLQRYEALVRWNQFDALVDFMHPDWLVGHPIRQLDVDRLKQFQVSQYRVRQIVAIDDGSGMDRLVELRLYHVHTARERTIQYVESWRWDEERERWMLHSGLPDVTQDR